MLFDPHLLTLRTSSDRKKPTVTISPLTTSGIRTVRGTARDIGGSGLAKVRVAIVYAVSKGNCRHFDGKKLLRGACKARTYVTASGRTSWKVVLPRTVKGVVAVFAQAIDRAGNVSVVRKRFAVVGRSRAK
jgi:hypothetical protein